MFANTIALLLLATGAAQHAIAIAEDIQNRVVKAGGNPKGDLSISLSWHTDDDLDLHLATPDGAEISYQNKRWRGGTLDVDMCVNGRSYNSDSPCSTHPVENIVFKDLKRGSVDGEFEIFIMPYRRHSSRPSQPINFEVLVRSGNTQELFSGLCIAGGGGRVSVLKFWLDAASPKPIRPLYRAQPNGKCGADAALPGMHMPGMHTTRKSSTHEREHHSPVTAITDALLGFFGRGDVV